VYIIITRLHLLLTCLIVKGTSVTLPGLIYLLYIKLPLSKVNNSQVKIRFKVYTKDNVKGLNK